MKKGFLILVGLAGILLAIGAGSAAIAAPTLSFDIDFYGGDTAYAQGAFDTGTTIELLPGDSVNVDLYFSLTEEGVVGGGFAMPFDALQLSASGLTIPSPWLDTGASGIDPGVINFEAFVWPPGTTLGPGDDILMASFVFTCTGIGLDDLYLNDLNAVTAQWVTSSGAILDDQLGGYLASISNVPIPGALWLLGSGLVGFVGIRRKMKR